MTTIDALKSRAAAALAAASLALVLLLPAPVAAAEAAGHGEASHVDWQGWKANNQIRNTASLQRGAAAFMARCASCHSVKYLRYERMAQDLGISNELLRKNLMPAGAKGTDYMLSAFPAKDAEAWFGRVPPDLSLITRSKGTDYVFQFLKGFYVDPTKATGTNNLALDGAAMPAVLSDLEGVKRAYFVEGAAAGGHGGKVVARFEQLEPGSLTEAEFDAYVRDIVNFLDYAGEPAKRDRISIGIWVMLFLLVFTAFAYLLKVEYWKDVH